jgi:hypothetical protein
MVRREGETYFIIKDSRGQKLAVVYFEDPRVSAKPLTRDEAWKSVEPVLSICGSSPCNHDKSIIKGIRCGSRALTELTGSENCHGTNP